MELLKFEGETLTDDGGIIRRIKVKGDGYTNPNDGAWVDGKPLIFFKDKYYYCASRLTNTLISDVGVFCVAVHLEGSCGGQVFDSRDVSFIVGEAEDKAVPLGVDRAMDKMQKGECCVLYLKPK